MNQRLCGVSRTLTRLLLTVGIVLFSARLYALESSVKAAFLYKFAGFVEWPAGVFQAPESPIVIAVIGDDAVAENLSVMVIGRSAQGRSIAVRRLAPKQSVAGAHMLFVGKDAAESVESVTGRLESQPVLLVTDSAGALEHGSMINFVLVDNRLRFEIALDTAERHGLKLSSRLLDVALEVRREAP